MSSEYGRVEGRVVLNIGGTKFETREETLVSRLSMFQAMFGGCSTMAKPDSRGEYFFDRDATHFRIILNYLRTGRVILPDRKVHIAELQQEAEYFACDEIRLACVRALGGLKFEDKFDSFDLDEGAWTEAPIVTTTSFDDPTPSKYAGMPMTLRVEEVEGVSGLRMYSAGDMGERRAIGTSDIFGADTQKCEVHFIVMGRTIEELPGQVNQDVMFELFMYNPSSAEYIGMFLHSDGATNDLIIVCYEGGHKKEKVVTEAWRYGESVRFTIQAFGDKTEVRINALKKKTFHVPVAIARIAPFRIVLGQRMSPPEKRNGDTSQHFTDVLVKDVTVYGSG